MTSKKEPMPLRSSSKTPKGEIHIENLSQQQAPFTRKTAKLFPEGLLNNSSKKACCGGFGYFPLLNPPRQLNKLRVAPLYKICSAFKYLQIAYGNCRANSAGINAAISRRLRGNSKLFCFPARTSGIK